MPKKGMTLIELVVVIAIIAIIVILAAVILNTARQNLRDVKRTTDVAKISAALEIYFNEYGAYPVQDGDIGSANANCLSEDGFEPASDCVGDLIFMDFVPAETGTRSASYHYFGETSRYCLSFTMERPDENNGLLPGLNKMTPEGFASGGCQ